MDRYLAELKAEADSLYENTEVYGIAGWGKKSVRNSRLYKFCRDLPKGAELHVHEMTLLPFERYIDIIRKNAWISLEEGDQCGYLYAENNPDRPANAVLLDEVLRSRQLSADELKNKLTMSGAEKKDGLWDVLNRSLYAARGLLTDQELVTRLFEESFRYAWDIGILLLELRIVSKGDEDYASSYQAQRRD